MTALPAWTDSDWAGRVAEPFRSDRDFWSSLAASADALLALVAAIAVSVVLALHGEQLWSVVPFAVPAGLAVRAAIVGRGSSRRSRRAFPDRRTWRDAERAAVAAVFVRVLLVPRLSGAWQRRSHPRPSAG
jgi:hypothetical protein